MSVIPSPLEPELKSFLINHLIEKWKVGSQDLIINEFTVGDFSRRVDLTLIKSNKTFAFEIKSDADSLSRLQGQVNKYLCYFDKVIVFTVPKHVEKALMLAPPQVAVWEINKGKISVKRRGKSKGISSKKELLEMMTAHELRKLSSSLKIPVPNTKRKTLEQVLTKVPVHKLREVTLQFIKDRYKNRHDKFFECIENRPATPADLKNLKLETRNLNREKPKSIESFILALEKLQTSNKCKLRSKNLVVNG